MSEDCTSTDTSLRTAPSRDGHVPFPSCSHYRFPSHWFHISRPSRHFFHCVFVFLLIVSLLFRFCQSFIEPPHILIHHSLSGLVNIYSSLALWSCQYLFTLCCLCRSINRSIAQSINPSVNQSLIQDRIHPFIERTGRG
jgi:hypothetical protein